MVNKTFIRITNKDIYNEIKDIKKLVGNQRTHIKVLYAMYGLVTFMLGILLRNGIGG